VAALVESFAHVCCRYRLRAFEPLLAEHGITLAYHAIPRPWWRRLRLGKIVADADVVVVQRKLLALPEAMLLRRAAKQLVFDIDDAVWLRDSHATKGFYSAKRQRRFRTLASVADLVICGNHYLAEHARSFGAKATAFIPTCVDLTRYECSTHVAPAQFVWIGSSSTLTGLEHLRPTLEQIGLRLPSASLKLICDRFFELRHLRVVECPWSETSETHEIAASSIGISWIPDDPWSRGKCGLKVLQYMAAGLPVIANPVGVHAEMIEHGVTGFLAASSDEWVAAATTLANDAALRWQMGQAGRRVVEERYSVAAGARSWVQCLQRVTQGAA
jgi:glycosyltransferase involved in cell wall biosynthesis